MGGSEQEEQQDTLAHQLYGVAIDQLNRKQRRHCLKVQKRRR